MREIFQRQTWQKVLLPFALSRVWVAIWVYVGHWNHPYLSPISGGYEGVANWWLNPWTPFDSAHYLAIAGEGYNFLRLTWFPLYPALLRLAGTDILMMAAWGFLLSNIAFAIALGVFYRLTVIDVNEKVATVAVWALAFFPTSAFFSAVYTESVFLLLISGAFWCVRGERWAWAGFFGFCAACTRNSGPIIFLALLAAFYKDFRLPETRRAPLKVLWCALPLLGFALVQGVHARNFGGALAGVKSTGMNYRSWDWPIVPIRRDVVDIASGVLDLTTLLNLAFTLLAFVALFGRRRMPVSHALLIIGVIAMHLTYARFIPPYTISSVRYLSTTFPFVQRMAEWMDVLLGNRFRLVLVSIIYISICAIQSYLFGEKAYLG